MGWIPLGGYVRMLDEREGQVKAEDLPRTFNRQRLRNRVAIVSRSPGSTAASKRSTAEASTARSEGDPPPPPPVAVAPPPPEQAASIVMAASAAPA